MKLVSAKAVLLATAISLISTSAMAAGGHHKNLRTAESTAATSTPSEVKIPTVEDIKAKPTDKKSAKRSKAKEDIPEEVRAELQAYHDKKKALREGLSPAAKEVLKKRSSHWKGKKKSKMKDKATDKHMDAKSKMEEKIKTRMQDKKPVDAPTTPEVPSLPKAQ